MNNIVTDKETLYLEDFDIKALSKDFPKYEIGVKTNMIYLHIAKYTQNPNRKTESKILREAILSSTNSKRIDTKYTSMKLEDVVTCFGKVLKTLPKTTFIQSKIFVTINESRNINL